MNIPKCGFRCLATVALVTFYLLLNTTIVKADTVYHISTQATFSLGNGQVAYNTTPVFTLTGNFTLDSPPPRMGWATTAGTITSFDMVLTPVGGSPYAFSSGTGNAQATCNYCTGLGWWDFDFSNANVSIYLPTTWYYMPLTTGTYYLGASVTVYPNGDYWGPWDPVSASASFGGVTGYTYVDDLTGFPTGYIHVDAVPEPPTFILLLVGVGLLLGVRRWSAQRV